MAATGVVEAVDVLEDGSFRLSPCWPVLPRDEFGFQAFEERLDRGIVVTITFAAHRGPQPLSTAAMLAIGAAAVHVPHGCERQVFGRWPSDSRTLKAVAILPFNRCA
jgi:hypothetical protein